MVHDPRTTTATSRGVDQLNDLEESILALDALDLPVPDEARRLTSALLEFRAVAFELPSLDDLEAAVREADTTTVRSRFATYTVALAMNEEHKARSVADLARRIVPEVDALLVEAAPGHYATLAGRYNAIAAKLHGCADIADVGADADLLIGRPAKQQQAWVTAADLAAEADRLIPPMLQLANRAGLWWTKLHDVVQYDRQIAALADVTTVTDQDALLDSWQQPTHRLGRLGHVLALGGRLRAPDTFDGVVLPKRQEYVTRNVMVDMGGGIRGVRQERVPA